MVEQCEVAAVIALAASLVERRERIGVLEARDDDAPILGSRSPDERQLPVMQHPHGRDEADRVARDPAFDDQISQLTDVMDDDHERRERSLRVAGSRSPSSGP